MTEIKTTALERALKSVLDAQDPPPVNDRERDGAIQRFEYTFEATWKLAQKIFDREGIRSDSPRSVIRDMAQQGWIQNPEMRLKFSIARNYTSHTYNEQVAQWIFKETQIFAIECTQLLKKFKSLV